MFLHCATRRHITTSRFARLWLSRSGLLVTKHAPSPLALAMSAPPVDYSLRVILDSAEPRVVEDYSQTVVLEYAV